MFLKLMSVDSIRWVGNCNAILLPSDASTAAHAAHIQKEGDADGSWRDNTFHFQHGMSLLSLTMGWTGISLVQFTSMGLNTRIWSSNDRFRCASTTPWR